jgi:ABC-2 type transport system permease protein
MKRMLLVFRRDYREMRATAAYRIMIGLMTVITAGAATGISIALRLQSWYGEPQVRPIIDLIMGLVVYFLPLFILLSFVWAFATLPVTREKVNGNIECLLATPLGPKTLLMGKGLAVFVPGYIISFIASVIILVVLNLAVILPGWGTLILPGPALVNGLVINPLLFFGLLLFTILFSLVNNPDIAIAPSFIIGFGLMLGMPVGLMTGVINISAWSFVLWYLVGTVVGWAVVLYLARLLTKQNIVLSSKGT